MKNRVNSLADPEKVNLSNLLLSGEEFKINSFDPDFSHTAPKMRKLVTFAPVTLMKGGGTVTKTRGVSQATRCPFCRVLVAVGPSFADHVHFCRGSQP